MIKICAYEKNQNLKVFKALILITDHIRYAISSKLEIQYKEYSNH